MLSKPHDIFLQLFAKAWWKVEEEKDVLCDIKYSEESPKLFGNELHGLGEQTWSLTRS